MGLFIEGETKLSLKFAEFPTKLRQILLERVGELTATLFARIYRLAPSKTGRLRGTLREEVFNDRDKIVGRVNVSAQFIKAASLEYGVDKTVSVEAHNQRLTHVFARAIGAEDVFVQKYSRHAHIIAKRFIREGTSETSGEAKQVLTQAVIEAGQS